MTTKSDRTELAAAWIGIAAFIVIFAALSLAAFGTFVLIHMLTH